MRRDFYSEYFDLENHHWWFRGRRAVFVRLLNRQPALAEDLQGRRVLDVGCGTGSMLIELARYGSAEGVDAAEEAVALCRQRGLDNVKRADGPPLPFESGSFDLVTALDVLEHVEDDAAMVRELQRLLKPGGTLLVSVPAYRFLWGAQDEIAHHRRRYVEGELRALLDSAGLDVVRLSYFNTLLFAPIAAIRISRHARRGSLEPNSDFRLTKWGFTNRLLTWVFSSEARLLEYVDLPFGVSLLAVATTSGRGQPGAASEALARGHRKRGKVSLPRRLFDVRRRQAVARA